jgi:hypothetical protein
MGIIPHDPSFSVHRNATSRHPIRYIMLPKDKRIKTVQAAKKPKPKSYATQSRKDKHSAKV